MRRVQIETFLDESKNGLLLDVRSPGEFNHAHIPGAVNLPLFTNEERKEVGTTYKQVSREAAIKIGLDFFGPKMRGMVEEVEKLLAGYSGWAVNENKDTRTTVPIFLYCWRGGMRSGAIAWLLNLYGFNVTVLAGGYKAFRNEVLRSFELYGCFKIIGGYTGSGKTEVLQQLSRNGEKVIDLEKLASHKGSAFGNINMPPQPSQEMFENLLSVELVAASQKLENINANLSTPQTGGIWLEDESQRIGLVNIPGHFWENMRRSPVYFLDIPFEERLEHILEEYSPLDKERLRNAIERINKRLGGLETKNAIRFLEEGNTRECFRILLHYYDKQYTKGLHNRQNLSTLLTKIPCEKVSVDNAGLVSQAQVASTYAGTH